jgi:restriction endonuclease S subunit
LLRNTVNTARANISLQNIRDLMVPVPPLDIQRKLCTTLTAMIDAQDQASRHSERLVLLKKQLVEETLRPGNSHV